MNEARDKKGAPEIVIDPEAAEALSFIKCLLKTNGKVELVLPAGERKNFAITSRGFASALWYIIMYDMWVPVGSAVEKAVGNLFGNNGRYVSVKAIHNACQLKDEIKPDSLGRSLNSLVDWGILDKDREGSFNVFRMRAAGKDLLEIVRRAFLSESAQRSIEVTLESEMIEAMSEEGVLRAAAVD